MIEKHIRKNYTGRLLSGVLLPAAVFSALTGIASGLHAQGQQPGYQGGFSMTSPLQLPALPVPSPVTANGTVIEDVIARVNDQVITRSEYEAAEQQLLHEGQQQNMSQADFAERQQNLLRDMIDQQILLSKGKELNISGDAEMMRQLDEIRKKNHFNSMEELEKAAAQQGVSFEDFKEGIKNSSITQQVIREQVGRRINLTHAQEVTYYAAHGKEFEVPEQIHLSEILVPTPDSATDAQIAEAQSKADALEAKLKAGSNFAELAKSSSGGPTAAAGGDLGDFKRGTLGDVLENATFPLAANSFTAPIRTRQGFVILRVDSHQAAGIPPLEAVEPQVEEGVYMDALQPALREYLTKARDELYIEYKPGFIDTGAPHKDSKTIFTAYAPPPVKKKVIEHQKAEQQKAATAQAELAAARAKVAEKNAEKAASQAATQAAKNPGKQNVSTPVKPVKIQREKIRYGQAPRNTLPTAPLETATVNNGALAGQAPGVAMALAESTTTISTGGEANDDPLALQTGPVHKTRFSDRQQLEDTQRLQAKVVKVDVKASIRPVQADAQTTANEKQQAAPLGLGGDTGKKPKPKHVKGEPKERMQEAAPKPADTTQPVAPTVNPALGTTPVAPAPSSTSAPQ